MEEAAKVIGGVAGELVFFMRSFLLGFLMRLGYEPIIFFDVYFVSQSFFWTCRMYCFGRLAVF